MQENTAQKQINQENQLPINHQHIWIIIHPLNNQILLQSFSLFPQKGWHGILSYIWKLSFAVNLH